MERVPYCLDFDIVQLARTAASADPVRAEKLRDRARTFERDLIGFFTGGAPDSYTLHKLPGALATLHECALICGDEQMAELAIAPIDIIADAYWI